MISLRTNVAALFGEQNLNNTQAAQSNTVEQLTSGYAINTAADNPAGLAIANALRSQQAELTQGVQNANNAVSQLQIVDGGLNNIAQILDRIKTLVVQGASSTFTGDYATLTNEIKQDLAEVDRQANNVGMGGGSNSFAQTLTVYIGGGLGTSNGGQIGQATEKIDLNGSTVGTTGLAINNLSTISNATDFQAWAASIETAVVALGKVQGAVGAGINMLTFAASLAQSQITNYSADESGIRDADIAKQAANLSKYQTLTQASMAALAQANQMSQSVMKLLQQ